MRTISTIAHKFINVQLSQAKGPLKPTFKLIDASKLRYLPKQLATDVFEVSNGVMNSGSIQETIETLSNSGKTLTQIAKELNLSTTGVAYHLKKMGLYKPTKVGNTPDIIDKNILEKLINSKKSVTEIATYLNVSPGKVRYFLEKYGIRNTNLEELKILRKYFSATTQKDKNEAFAIIDKYLEQIAKEKYQLDSGISFDDYLQDLRLKFLELAEKRKKRSLEGSRNIFQELRDLPVIKKKEIETVEFFNELNEIGDLDFNIKNFEESDFFDNFIEESSLVERQKKIVTEYLKGHKDFEQLAEELGLTPQRVKHIFNMSIDRLRKIEPSNISQNEGELAKAKEISNKIQDIANKTENESFVKLKDTLFYYLSK